MLYAWTMLELGWMVAGAQASAPDRMQTQTQSVDVPAGERLVLTAEGRGVQLYDCELHDAKTSWTFVAPEASLSLDNREVATHGAGPVWHHQDGSWVAAEVVAKMASPSPGAIPMLLLRVNRHDGNAQGLFAKVNFVQRLETTGGVAPASQCETGATLRVPYSAVYRFYAPNDQANPALPQASEQD